MWRAASTRDGSAGGGFRDEETDVCIWTEGAVNETADDFLVRGCVP